MKFEDMNINLPRTYLKELWRGEIKMHGQIFKKGIYITIQENIILWTLACVLKHVFRVTASWRLMKCSKRPTWALTEDVAHLNGDCLTRWNVAVAGRNHLRSILHSLLQFLVVTDFSSTKKKILDGPSNKNLRDLNHGNEQAQLFIQLILSDFRRHILWRIFEL